jgi:hypothetical protein
MRRPKWEFHAIPKWAHQHQCIIVTVIERDVVGLNRTFEYANHDRAYSVRPDRVGRFPKILADAGTSSLAAE